MFARLRRLRAFSIHARLDLPFRRSVIIQFTPNGNDPNVSNENKSTSQIFLPPIQARAV
jgi:hypothetical protein